MPPKSAAIVGAGVGGLVAALSLAQNGVECDIVEQAPQLGEVGAGLQLSPNATWVLGQLGVLAEIEKHWREPDFVRLSSGLNLRSIAALPAGAAARTRWGAPYGVLHRSTLQQCLLSAVLRHPLCHLHLGTRIENADRRALSEIAGRSISLVVGADGVWSRTRAGVAAAPKVSFSGNVAWRFTLNAAAAPDFLDGANVTAFLGPRTHLVTYPLREINGFNVVAIAAGVDPGETWAASGSEAQRAALVAQFSAWNPAIRSLLSGAAELKFWPLFEAGPGRWQNGGDTALVGDAAHAMMPFAAQGAAMAIEDGFELAALVARLPLPLALGHYERRRQQRAARVRKRGNFNRFAYHATGPARIARDLVLAMRSPASLAGDLDWLYGFRAGQ